GFAAEPCGHLQLKTCVFPAASLLPKRGSPIVQPMSEGTLLDAEAKDADLKSAFAALSKDYGSLTARVRALSHSIACTCSGVTLRLHFPAFRQSKPTLPELVDAIAVYL